MECSVLEVLYKRTARLKGGPALDILGTAGGPSADFSVRSSKLSYSGNVPQIRTRVPTLFKEHSLNKSFWKVWVCLRFKLLICKYRTNPKSQWPVIGDFSQ